jgi:hypothetical protein
VGSRIGPSDQIKTTGITTAEALAGRLAEDYLRPDLTLRGLDDAISTIQRAFDLIREDERERCARRVERFFAPCSGVLEIRYGRTLAAHLREGT